MERQRTLRSVLRIIAGEFRSRTLAVPRGRDLTRPMGSRTREALFDLLRGWFDGATVLDLFAGVGTLGLEAASRGAARVVCVERDRFIARLLRENIHALRCEDRVTAIEGDAMAESTLSAFPRPVDLVLCDPPFSMAHEERASSGSPSTKGASRDLEPGDSTHARRAPSRDEHRLESMLPRLRPLFGEKGFLVIRRPEARRGEAGRIAGFDGPEVHGYGDQQWLHLHVPSKEIPS